MGIYGITCFCIIIIIVPLIRVMSNKPRINERDTPAVCKRYLNINKDTNTSIKNYLKRILNIFWKK